MNGNRPIVGWPEWTFTTCFYVLTIVTIYLQVSKLPSAARGVGEGQAARQCCCVVETP